MNNKLKKLLEKSGNKTLIVKLKLIMASTSLFIEFG